MEKSYLAIVIGDPGRSGRISAPTQVWWPRASENVVDASGQSAISLFLRLAIIGDYALELCVH